MVEPLDTTNDFCVGVRGNGDLLITMPPLGVVPRPAALRLAAYLVLLADPTPDHSQFAVILAAVRST